MFIDSHCHLDRLNFAKYSEDNIAEALEAALANKVTQVLSVCTSLDDWPSLLTIAEHYKQVDLSVGVHPTEVNHYLPTVEDLITIGNHERVVAIGETGLDYAKTTDKISITRQQIAFRNHITAARVIRKPLVIHVRNAYSDVIRIIKEESATEIGGVIHCFTENWKIAEQFITLGFYISFSGILTFKNAQNVQNVAKQITANRILLETDSPYLAPIPFRGKPNHPALLKYIAIFIAKLRNEQIEYIANITKENYLSLFYRHQDL